MLIQEESLDSQKLLIMPSKEPPSLLLLSLQMVLDEVLAGNVDAPHLKFLPEHLVLALFDWILAENKLNERLLQAQAPFHGAQCLRILGRSS